MIRIIKFAFVFSLLMGTPSAWGYPLDGYPYTGIKRLEGFRLAQKGKVHGIRVPYGARLAGAKVDLRLLNRSDFKIPTADPQFTAELETLLGEASDRYGFAVLDLTNIDHPVYAHHRGNSRANPGSVGKIVVALGVFQALADIYPSDFEQRLNILRNANIVADQFIVTDKHKVPLWEPGDDRIRYRPIKVGDQASLWTYLDWMLSASSNAAASMVMRELMLLVQFGEKYPPTLAVVQQFFRETPKKGLGDLLARAIQRPLTRNGFDLRRLRQGSFFTWKGKQLVPGTTSHASPKELLRWLIKLEQGQLVDPFSSREIKRLLYMTQGRIRYASSPALYSSAVYFKSGSLYKCKPEPGFTCSKYSGNAINLLNSLIIVESPTSEGGLYYMVVVMSNVLRKNSAAVHQTFATRVHRLIQSRSLEKKTSR